ncbi:MAG: mechanosensitive ion channel family protein [Polyangiales bacterium]
MPVDQLYDDVTSKLSAWADTFGEMLPNIIVALLALALFWLLARVACGAADRALRRFDTHEAARDLISRIVRIGGLLTGVVVALGVMNLDKALASILAGAGIVGLALGFAFQDLAGNLISGVGLAIHQRWPFKIGDVVETNDVFGVVEKIYLRTSIIRTLDGKTAVIPNKQIYQNKVLNHSASGTRRVDLACGVSYGDDLEEVRRVVRDTLASVEPRDRFRDVEVFFTGFGSSSIHLVGRFWVDYEKQPDFLDAQSRAIIAVKKAFDANDIVIPFPIRTLDFGIRGGRPLAESFPKIEVNGRSQEAS